MGFGGWVCACMHACRSHASGLLMRCEAAAECEGAGEGVATAASACWNRSCVVDHVEGICLHGVRALVFLCAPWLQGELVERGRGRALGTWDWGRDLGRFTSHTRLHTAESPPSQACLLGLRTTCLLALRVLILGLVYYYASSYLLHM